ncbi:MAG: PD-(D/E)XK nuclease family protein [Steroidobacteraceae bacterium]
MLTVPKILGIHQVETVTFYQLLDLGQCHLKGLSKAFILNGKLPELPPTRSQLIGKFHHRLMELAVKSASLAELDNSIEDEIRKLQAVVNASTVLKRQGSASGWHEVNQSATLARAAIVSRASELNESITASEVELRSRHGVLVGRPDRFNVRNGVAKLYEYKTSRVRTDAGEPFPDHIEQVLFYSALIFDNYQVERITARVESLNGDYYESEVRPLDADAFVRRVSDLLEALNKKISNQPSLDSFATPDPKTCLWCRNQIVCSAFKSSQRHFDLVGEQYLCEGVVTNVTKCSTDSARSVTVLDMNRQISVTFSIPVLFADDLVIGMPYLFQCLRSHGEKLAWGSFSRVLSHE